jgi:hypothetical protein
MSTYIKQTKRPELMSLDELREAANNQAVHFFRDKAPTHTTRPPRQSTTTTVYSKASTLRQVSQADSQV